MIFDVDRNTVKMKADLFERVPRNQEQYLLKNLRLILSRQPAGAGESLAGPPLLGKGGRAGEADEAAEKRWWVEASLRTKKVFLNFFLMMVNNFFAFYRTDVKL